MPPNNNDIEKRLWSAADELRANPERLRRYQEEARRKLEEGDRELAERQDSEAPNSRIRKILPFLIGTVLLTMALQRASKRRS